MGKRGWSLSTPGCIVSGLLFHACALLLLFAVWLAVGLPFGTHRLKAAEAAWSQGFLTPEQLAARYPDQEHSPAARRLEDLARKLETQLFVGRGVPLVASDRWEKLGLKKSWAHLNGLSRQHERAPLPVPPDLVRVLAERAETFTAIEEVLVGDGAVLWKKAAQDRDLHVSLLGLRNIHSALLVRALIADQKGDAAARDRSLEASWRLTESLAHRIDPLEKLIAHALVRERNGCLRYLRPSDPKWESRVRDRRPLTTHVDEYQDEAQFYCRSAQRMIGVADLDYLPLDVLPEVTFGRWLVRLFTAPYVRLNVAAYSDALRRESERMRKRDACPVDIEAYGESVKASQPPWHILSRISLPTRLKTWIAARDAALDDELTVAVLELLRLGGKAGFKESRKRSEACASLTWSYSVEGGALTVEAEGEPVAEGQDEPRLYYSVTVR